MALKTATRTSTLNPNAPMFIPASFHAAEDFSPEWWNLIQTCPAYRDFWLRERFHDSVEDAACLLDEDAMLDAIDDLLDMDMGIISEEELMASCEEMLEKDFGSSERNEKDLLCSLLELNLNESQTQRTWREPVRHHDKVPSLSPRKQMRGGNQFRIHQPRA